MDMDGRWRLSRVKLWMVLLLLHQNVIFCWSLNAEGLALLKFRENVKRDPFGALSNWNKEDGDIDPCLWFGVECSDEKVVSLHLKDLCLEGTLAPELGKLAYLKSIILRNNSFFGNIPKEIGELEDLKLLDLGYNNFSGPFPSELANDLSLTTFISHEVDELEKLSEIQADKNQLSASCSNRGLTWNLAHCKEIARKLLLQVIDATNPSIAKNHKVHHSSSESSPFLSILPPSFPPSGSPPSSFLPSNPPSFSSLSFPPTHPLESPSFAPSESPSSLPSQPSPSPTESPSYIESPTKVSPTPAHSSFVMFAPSEYHAFPVAPSSSLSQGVDDDFNSKHEIVLIASVVGGSLLLLVSAAGAIFFRSNKVVTVKPWATGLSGQLQKAFVTGVPKLKRLELEAACEDFSNIIGYFLNGTVYKGTLSSGVEIAVTSFTVKSIKEWSKYLEAQFKKKIDTLSKMNHKNFVNLIGYCEENEPFTRMMVFEYAPNGTLFEHLHIKEAEHLDWGTRVRIAMGMAYCLEYMHQITPPIVHENLQSSSIYLTEDYAAKISNFSYWNDVTTKKIESTFADLIELPSVDPESNVYSFGIILYEMITGRMLNAMDKGFVADWTTKLLKEQQSMEGMIDPTLKYFRKDEIEKLLLVIKSCIHPDAKQRPTMCEVVAKLKEIISMGPDEATPKLSPLWWAELEILSTEEGS
ncbi:inactive receptor-like serine/threonine-protein kinase At2g40270 isoform X2 [Manihot esculenta]|uniref:Uncharacterized protein n=1 Tax=Manihot esculenta TaxID=3983 RepID=A0ACB7G2P0_MANES|nr:inactive receptor-like serine/threonine-protein kinase At2g40270 isoform X2 [Manihot esculenta]KAG8633798.1 hypothetical protein MANES_18G136200v8 [Manihot esculenta]